MDIYTLTFLQRKGTLLYISIHKFCLMCWFYCCFIPFLPLLILSRSMTFQVSKLPLFHLLSSLALSYTNITQEKFDFYLCGFPCVSTSVFEKCNIKLKNMFFIGRSASLSFKYTEQYYLYKWQFNHVPTSILLLPVFASYQQAIQKTNELFGTKEVTYPW